MRRVMSVLLAVIFVLGCITACAKGDDEPVQLWVVTEITGSRGMNGQVRYYMEQFQNDHPNVWIQLDILPTESTERAEYIKELYDKIKSGEGPDIYLLPVKDVVRNDYKYMHADPMLFPDVELAMRAGVFADISHYYNFDFSLGKSALQSTVMDAGVVNSSRYVLPLSYGLRTIYYFPDRLSAGTELDIENATYSDLMQYVIDIGDPVIASGVDNLRSDSNFTLSETFSNLIDYDSGEITLSVQDLEEFFSIYQKLQVTIGPKRTEYGIIEPVNAEKIINYTPLKVSWLSNAPALAAYAKYTGSTLKMAPVRNDDGDVIATVSYYGAIGSGCKNIETAYEFLRIFLTEDAQWETKKLENRDILFPGSIWPVRVKGSVPYLWNSQQIQLESRDGTLYRSGYNSIELTDQDIPVLETEIDMVRFPFANNFYQHWIQLVDYNNGAAPTDVDMEALTEAFIQDLESTYNSNLNSLPKKSSK